MLEIKLADADVTGGSVPVGWCLNQEMLAKLAEKEVKDPQVVLVVRPEGEQHDNSREFRTVVPLRDLIGYVEFRVAGKNNIWGFISMLPTRDMVKSRYLS